MSPFATYSQLLVINMAGRGLPPHPPTDLHIDIALGHMHTRMGMQKKKKRKKAPTQVHLYFLPLTILQLLITVHQIVTYSKLFHQSEEESA